MKDKNGFLIRCEHCEWKIISDKEEQDFVCQKFGSSVIDYHICFADENCRYYEPDIKRGDDNG